MATLIGTPLACADEPLVVPEVAPVDDPVVVLLVADLLLDEHAAAARMIAKAHAPYESFLLVINLSPL
jgi:hypothetical protein